jgi:NADH:ubiquinone oxidoreductase subunit K
MDWSTIFPYALIGAIILFGIGIYSIITSKKFIRIVIGIEILFMAAIILLLSFGLGFTDVEGENIIPDPIAQVFALLIIVVSIIFLIIGTAIDRRLRQSDDSTIIDFNFNVDEVQLLISTETNTQDTKKESSDRRG